MKFMSLALFAAIVASAGATKSLSGDELNAMLRSGKIDTKTLLKSAVPYRKEALRHLKEEDERDEEEEEDYFTKYGALGEGGITGDHSISFNSCVSLSVEEDWENLGLSDNEYLGYFIQWEKVVSVRNYVLFNVCETMGDCSNLEVSESNTYMIDLNTWVTALLDYFPTQQEKYCEGCQNQAEYCADGSANGWNQGIDYTTAAFFYDDIKFQLINCNQCNIFRCYDEEGDAYEQNGWDEVAEWIGQLASCQETNGEWLDMNLYAGLMCNQAGTGLEIGVFVDDECTIYTTQKSYLHTLENGDNNDYESYYKSQRIMNYMFNKQFDCYGGDLIYVNLFQEVYQDQDGSSYDPCSSSYYDEEACKEMMEEVPCYPTYNEEDGTWEVEDEEACEEFMEENPCWSMAGQGVAQAYQQSCYEYMASYSHQASDTCLALFGYEGDNGNANAEPAVALSSCAYQYQTEEHEGEKRHLEERDGDAEAEGEGEAEGQQGQFSNFDFSYLTYDISYDMTQEDYGVCNLVDGLFASYNHLNSQVYDTAGSGQMYDYSDLGDETYNDGSSGSSGTGSGGTASTYFPTINMPSSVSRAVEDSRNLSAGAIVGLTALAAVSGFVLLVVAGKIKKAYAQMEEDFPDTSDPKDIPLMD